MKNILYGMACTLFSFIPSYGTSELSFTKDFIRGEVERGMNELIESLTLDELIELLEVLGHHKYMSLYSTLGMKLFICTLYLEKSIPEFSLLDEDDENDSETLRWLEYMYTNVYARARELLPLMPHVEHYRIALMQQLRPEEYKELLDKESEEVRELFLQ